MMIQHKFIEFEEGWHVIQNGFTKLKRIIEGLPEPEFSPEEYIELYTTIYNMCGPKPPYDYSPKLYQIYKELFEEYISLSVLPSLREKHDEFMLRELVKRWANHKVMVRRLSHFFDYLDRFYVPRSIHPSLNVVGLTCFRDLVYEELKGKVRAAVITLVDQEREGGQIDRALMKNVLVLFVEIRSGRIVDYEKDFEEDDLLKDSASCYSWKALNWIFEDSCPNYMLKAEQCLEKGRDEQCSEKKRDRTSPVMVEELSMMYRLCRKIPGGLELIADIFKQHFTAKVTALVQQAEDAAGNKAEIAVGSLEQGCVRKVIELHDKYMAYVNDCFDNHSLFQKALEEAFAEFCNQKLGCSSAELLASFSDDIPKEGGAKQVSDEAIEDTLQKLQSKL